MATHDEDNDNDEVLTRPEGKDDGNTPEAEAPAPAAPAPAPEEGAMIPKGRFNEVLTDRNALREQNAELMALLRTNKPAVEAPAPPAAPAFDIEKAEEQWLAALAAGNDSEALKLRREIRAAEKAEAQHAAEAVVEAREQRNQAGLVKEAAAEIKAKYPELNEKSDTKNDDAIDFVVAKRDRLVAQGIPAHKALAQAAENAAKLFGFGGGEAVPTPVKTDTRAIEARSRNADAANRQPPVLGGKGDRSTQNARTDVAAMSDAEFAALPEAEKARLRGDV